MKARITSVTDKMMSEVLEWLYTFLTESDASAFLRCLGQVYDLQAERCRCEWRVLAVGSRV